ncbi:hypothetical protein [Vibrio gallaecicus]|nr:hypothetical protein [Vibrio gallaecicus]MDN3617240.1 hypothetical protein [Vibrio gallaecicus]
MAFPVRIGFSDFGGRFKYIGSVVSYLIGRYTLWEKAWRNKS